MSLCIQLEACSLLWTFGFQGTGRALDAQWKRQGIQWKMACRKHQRTWLKKFSSRKCISLPDLETYYQKSNTSLFGQSSNRLWLVTLLFWAVTQSSEKERPAACFHFSPSQVWSWLPLPNGERTHPCSHLSLSSPRLSKEQEGESYGWEILFSINYTESKQEKLPGRGILSEASNCPVLV